MIQIAAVVGLATVQDGGRPGRMHEGVPPGGALVPEMVARANAAAGNDHDDAAVELFGSATLVARESILVASDDGMGRELRADEPWTIACGRMRVRYLAVRGGIDVPVVLGGRGTLLVAGLGGHEGRPLRKGDRLRVRDAAARVAALPPLPDLTGPVRVVPGPDLERFVAGGLDDLLSSSFEVSARSNRVGVRLLGPPIGRADDDDAVSAPMVRGAIQVPRSGEPIVLGPDHPTTGGYPVLATVLTADLGALLAHPLGSRLRFVLAT
jgi:5-oxoprolinase (ATP-hydrolysing) subunit C